LRYFSENLETFNLEQKNISSIVNFPSQNEKVFSTAARYFDFLNSIKLIFQSKELRSLILPQDFKISFISL
jgi:hypothetical protein